MRGVSRCPKQNQQASMDVTDARMIVVRLHKRVDEEPSS